MARPNWTAQKLLFYEPEGGGHLGSGDRDRNAAKEALIMTYFVRKLAD